MALDPDTLADNLTDSFEGANGFDSEGKIKYKGEILTPDEYSATRMFEDVKAYLEAGSISTTETGAISSPAASYSGSGSGKINVSTGLKSDLKSVFKADGSRFSSLLSAAIVKELSSPCITSSGSGTSTYSGGSVPTKSSGSGNFTCVPTVMSSIVDQAITTMATTPKQGKTSRDINSILAKGIANGIHTMVTSAVITIQLSLTPTGTGTCISSIS